VETLLALGSDLSLRHPDSTMSSMTELKRLNRDAKQNSTSSTTESDLNVQTL